MRTRGDRVDCIEVHVCHEADIALDDIGDRNQPSAAQALKELHNAEIRNRIGTLGFEVTGTTGEALAQIQRADYARWGPIIKASGFKADQ